MSDSPALLVFGASNAVGHYFLQAIEQPCLAISRHPQAELPKVLWLRSDFEHFQPSDAIEHVVCLGALDAFESWFKRQSMRPLHVVALSSLSRFWKAQSPDPKERLLAASLAQSETALRAQCQARSCTLTLVRPSLIWGAGRDHSLTPLARSARRFRLLPMPNQKGGLRAPVHASDVATAVHSALTMRCDGAVHVEGAERLHARQVLKRIARSVGALALPIPGFAVQGALRVARMLKVQSGPGAWQRYLCDQVLESIESEAIAFQSRRGFDPVAADWERD